MARPAKESSNHLIEYLSSLEGLGRRALNQIATDLVSWENFLSLDREKIAARFSFLSDVLRSALLAARARAGSFRPSDHYLSFLDPEFPLRLTALYDPPAGIYYRGQIELLRNPGPWIAVVGTRNPSPYALRYCAQMVAAMKPFSPIIVSGLALGIDGMAHRAALAQGLKTVGVLGSSVEEVYPARHRELALSMIREGLLLSEQPTGTAIVAWLFPKRNRLIAALSDAVVVVEAPEKSGALLTADFALDLGKEIYVVPGPVDGDRNRGGHRLIQQGAKLLLDPKEIFHDLGIPESPSTLANSSLIPAQEQAPVQLAAPPTPAPMECKLLEIIGFTPCHIDKITDMSHLPSPRVTGLLVQMSLKGLVVALPGGFFELGPPGWEWLSKTE